LGQSVVEVLCCIRKESDMIFKLTELQTKDGLSIYDQVEPQPTDLNLLAGPKLLLEEIEIRSNSLPEGFKWVSVEDIEQFFNI